MKKGFTLVELLAAIIVLGVIGLIAVPRINNSIYESRMSVIKLNYEILENAASDYFAQNISSYNIRVGNSAEVSFDTLKEKGMIDSIKSPFYDDDCGGYATITRVSENNYEINPHIKCGDLNHINSSSDDGLVLHYNFSDFQEATENILPDVENDIYFRPEGSWYAYSGASVEVNQGVHSSALGTNNATEIKITGGSHTLKYLTQGIAPAPNGVPYTASIKVENIGENTLLFRTQYGGSRTIQPGEADDIAISIVGNGSSNFQMRFESQNIGDELHFLAYQPQIEQKPYSTPFTEHIREGLVVDRSLSGFNSTLQVATTPRWMIDTDLNKPVYEFDGISSYINTERRLNFSKTDSFSVSFWINAQDHSHKSGAAAGLIGKGHWYSNTWDVFLRNSNRISFEVSGDPTRNGIRTITTQEITINSWHHYVATYDSGNMSVYFDGELIGTTIYTGEGDFDGDRDVRIGTRHTDLSRTLDGKMANVRIYNRALTAQEISDDYEYNNFLNK